MLCIFHWDLVQLKLALAASPQHLPQFTLALANERPHNTTFHLFLLRLGPWGELPLLVSLVWGHLLSQLLNLELPEVLLPTPKSNFLKVCCQSALFAGKFTGERERERENEDE